MRIAARIAERSEERMKHGAIIVSGGRLLAVGINRNILDPFYYPNAPKLSIHAEEAAIRSLRQLCNANRTGDHRRYTLFVARSTRNGMSLSAPCSNCERLISEFGLIKKVVHS